MECFHQSGEAAKHIETMLPGLNGGLRNWILRDAIIADQAEIVRVIVNDNPEIIDLNPQSLTSAFDRGCIRSLRVLADYSLLEGESLMEPDEKQTALLSHLLRTNLHGRLPRSGWALAELIGLAFANHMINRHAGSALEARLLRFIPILPSTSRKRADSLLAALERLPEAPTSVHLASLGEEPKLSRPNWPTMAALLVVFLILLLYICFGNLDGPFMVIVT